MTLKEAERLAKREMRKHKLNKVYEFRFINDPLTFGECMGKPEYYIALSRPLVKLNRKDIVLDTIKHEIAHALDFMKRGFSVHDRKWKRIAEEVGCNPPFRATCADDNITVPHSPYVMVCQKCGYCEPRYRKPSKIPRCPRKKCRSKNAIYQLLEL